MFLENESTQFIFKEHKSQVFHIVEQEGACDLYYEDLKKEQLCTEQDHEESKSLLPSENIATPRFSPFRCRSKRRPSKSVSYVASGEEDRKMKCVCEELKGRPLAE